MRSHILTLPAGIPSAFRRPAPMCSGARGHSSRPGALKKQRVLALHGYQQDANSFRAKTGALRKALLDIAEINYIDAPHSVPPGLTWWRATKDGSEYNGFTDSLAHVRAYIAAEGPFDGVLGFSQGGVFASILGAMGATRAEEAPELHSLRFAVMFSAFPSRAAIHTGLWYTRDVPLKSLHVWGERDSIVPPVASEALRARFRDAETVLHPGGHVVPGAREPLDAVRAFVERCSRAAQDNS